ncbi:MAG: tetratricopeptide repeat-containing sensor histidine kinase [Bacteroidota bacterium]
MWSKLGICLELVYISSANILLPDSRVKLTGIILAIYLPFSTLAASFSQEKPGTLLVDSLNNRAASFRFINIDSLDFYAEEAYHLATELNYIPGLVESTRLRSTGMIVRGNYADAIELLFNKKLLIENSDFVKDKAVIDYYIGVAYSTSGNYKASLPYLNASLERFRDLDDANYVQQCLNNIGVCYIRLDQFSQALEIFKEIEQVVVESNPGLTTTLMVNLAYCYYGLGEFEKAKNVIIDFLAIPTEEIDERGYGFAYFKLGEVYAKEEDAKKAISAFNLSIEVFEKFESYTDKVEPLNGLAEVYLTLRDYDKANYYVDQSLDIAVESGVLSLQKLAFYTSYKILKVQKRYKEALERHEKYHTIADSLVETQQSAEMGRLTAQYGFNEEKNDLLLAQKEAELENQQVVSNQQLTINISIVVIVAIVVVLIFVYRAYSLKINGNKLLKEKNNQIKAQRDVLEETNRVKNKLFSIIAHDLRSPINTLNGLLYLVRNKMADQEDLETTLPKLIDSFDHASNLLNNLLNWAIGQMEGYTLEFKDFKIKEVFERCLASARFRLEEKSITCTIEGEDASVFGEENMIEIVCQNLLGNAIKYCEHGDTINLKISVSNNVCVQVIDTGIGISADKIDILLNENDFLSTAGTYNEKGSGLGLMICKDMLKKNNSDLKIESVENAGSTFSFCLPKSS